MDPEANVYDPILFFPEVTVNDPILLDPEEAVNDPILLDPEVTVYDPILMVMRFLCEENELGYVLSAVLDFLSFFRSD